MEQPFQCRLCYLLAYHDSMGMSVFSRTRETGEGSSAEGGFSLGKKPPSGLAARAGSEVKRL
jgi:hypothetical protein